MVDVGAPARAPCNLHAIDMENMMFELRTEANKFAQRFHVNVYVFSALLPVSTLDHQLISVSAPYNAHCAKQAKL